VKSPPVRGVKENLKPYAYKQSEGYAEQVVDLPECLMACLLEYEPAS
jgi:hypothetical protein